MNFKTVLRRGFVELPKHLNGRGEVSAFDLSDGALPKSWTCEHPGHLAGLSSWTCTRSREFCFGEETSLNR